MANLGRVFQKKLMHKQNWWILATTWNIVGSSCFLYTGMGTTFNSNELSVVQRMTPCKVRNLSANPTSNANTANQVIRSRPRQTNGNINLTVPALTLGIFKDSSNFDVLALDDLFCLNTDTAVTGITSGRMNLEFDLF